MYDIVLMILFNRIYENRIDFNIVNIMLLLLLL